MDKFEIIKNFLLDENISPEIRRERFEIAWDIKENFDKIKAKLSLEKVIKPLKEKFEQYLNTYTVSRFDYGSIYITKPHWKESKNDRGIVAIAIERWFKDTSTVGLVKNTGSKLPLEDEVRNLLEQKYGLRTTHSWWLGYLPDERKLPTTKLPLREYYLQILLNSERVIEEHFLALKEVLDIANEKEISQLLEKIVKERKKQTL
ncbi:MAG: hypothetical protein DSZ31_03730 [Gammaproteobacteria bacterium]|nr:MAG: hypothetical protein DSZ31_03730 [Gammaproteobacteria bacterium]